MIDEAARAGKYQIEAVAQNADRLGVIVGELRPSRTGRNMKPGSARPIVVFCWRAPVSIGRFKNASGRIGNRYTGARERETTEIAECIDRKPCTNQLVIFLDVKTDHIPLPGKKDINIHMREQIATEESHFVIAAELETKPAPAHCLNQQVSFWPISSKYADINIVVMLKEARFPDAAQQCSPHEKRANLRFVACFGEFPKKHFTMNAETEDLPCLELKHIVTPNMMQSFARMKSQTVYNASNS